jgi:hypothetical protein
MTDNLLFTPVDEVPEPVAGSGTGSRYRRVCEDFLASGARQVLLNWRAFAPGCTLDEVVRNWRSFFSDPCRKAPAGIRVVKRGDEMYLVREDSDD